MKGFVEHIIANIEDFEEELEYEMLKKEHDENMRFVEEELDLL